MTTPFFIQKISMSVLKLFQENIGKVLEKSPSAVSNWLAGKILKAEKGKLVLEFLVREEMTNPMKSLHGGVVAMIHDDIIGMTVITLGREMPYTSINLTVDFLKASTIGDVLIAETEIIRSGNKIIYVHSTIYKIKDNERVIISKATSNMLRFG